MMVADLILGICIGIVLKILIPMPGIDDPVRRAWGWVYSKISR